MTTYRLFCRECGVPISRSLRALDGEVRLKPEDGKPLVPQGGLVRAESLLDEDENSFGVKRGDFIFNIKDLESTLLAPDSVGCCGADGRNSPNR